MDIKKNAVKARFYSDIEEMMYGFGDDWPPLRESVNLLDAIAVKYIEDLSKQMVMLIMTRVIMIIVTTVVVVIMMIIAMGRI